MTPTPTSEFGLSKSQTGVYCDADGAFIASVPLMRKNFANGKPSFEPRDSDALSAEIGERYGLPIDLSSREKGLRAIASALNDGDIVRAQLLTIFLRFPTPPQFPGLTKAAAVAFVHALGANGLLKTWEPDEHPRWPAGAPDSQGGQFAPKNSDVQVADADADPEDEELETESAREAESRANWSAAEVAGEQWARERAAEETGEETPETSRSRIDRIENRRERYKYWKEESKKDPALRQLDSLLYTPDNLSLMGRGRSPIGRDGFPMELHHPEGDPDAPVEPMSRTDHRLGPNYLRNHPWLRPKKRMVDIFAAADSTRRKDLGAVFHADERVGWLYLCHIFGDGSTKIIKPVHVMNGMPDYRESDVEVRWFDNDSKVGVLIKGQLWAYFDLTTDQSYKGRYPSEPLKWPSQ